MPKIVAEIEVSDPKGSVIKGVIVSTENNALIYNYQLIREVVAIFKRDYPPLMGTKYGRLVFTLDGRIISSNPSSGQGIMCVNFILVRTLCLISLNVN